MAQLNMTKGLIPLPPRQDRLIPDKQNMSWNDLGPMEVWGFTLHRQLGKNQGTDRYFRMMGDARSTGKGGLTTYGSDANSDELFWWNDETGAGHVVSIKQNASGWFEYTNAGDPMVVSKNRAAWASGPYSGAYGDGLAFAQKYGVNAINRNRVSWEIDEGYNDGWDLVSMQVAALACAHYAHDYGITYEQFPIHPKDGFSFVCWHQEFTRGTGKICPGPVVMAKTSEFIEMTRAIMKSYQTKGIEPKPVPQPTYTLPILPDWWGDQLELQRPNDAKYEGHTYYVVQRAARCVAATGTVRRSAPHAKADPSGPKVMMNDKPYIERFVNIDGTKWIVEDAGHYLLASKFTPEMDFKARKVKGVSTEVREA